MLHARAGVMMTREVTEADIGDDTDTIELTQNELRAVAGWAANCAERALPVFETQAPDDSRPRAALAGAREFAAGAKRSARLRSLVWATYAAAKEVDAPAAAAARAAGVAAGVAYTHPLAKSSQTKHLLGPATYAALARELEAGGDPAVGDNETRWAIEHAPAEVRLVLRRFPVHDFGSSRMDALYRRLDAQLRAD